MAEYRKDHPDYGAENTRKYLARTPEKKPLRSLKRKEYRRRVNLEKSEAVRKLKDRPCMDCGGKFPAIVMDFDHREPKEKKYNISFLVATSGASLEKILVEIKKCDLVCANCHRIRTFKRILASDCQVCDSFVVIDFQI